jgi:hypothetical protein
MYLLYFDEMMISDGVLSAIIKIKAKKGSLRTILITYRFYFLDGIKMTMTMTMTMTMMMMMMMTMTTTTTTTLKQLRSSAFSMIFVVMVIVVIAAAQREDNERHPLFLDRFTYDDATTIRDDGFVDYSPQDWDKISCPSSKFGVDDCLAYHDKWHAGKKEIINE